MVEFESIPWFWFLAGFLVWSLSLRVLLNLNRRLPPGQASCLKGGLLLFGTCYLLLMLLQRGAFTFLGEAEGDEIAVLKQSLLVLCLVEGFVCLLALVYLTFRPEKGGLKAAGFVFSKPVHYLGLALSGYIAFLPVYAIFCWINFELLPDYETQELVQLMQANPELHRSLFMIVATILVVPLIEEILFRGFLLSGLREFTGAGPAVIVSAALFGMMHMKDLSAVVPTFALGLILGYFRVRAGSLLPSVIGHMAHNFLMLILILSEA